MSMQNIQQTSFHVLVCSGSNKTFGVKKKFVIKIIVFFNTIYISKNCLFCLFI